MLQPTGPSSSGGASTHRLAQRLSNLLHRVDNYNGELSSTSSGSGRSRLSCPVHNGSDGSYLRRALRPSLSRCSTARDADTRRRLQALATPPPHPHTPTNEPSSHPWSDQLGGVPPAPMAPSHAELHHNALSTSHLGRAFGRNPKSLVAGAADDCGTKRKAAASTSAISPGRDDRAKRCRQQLRTVGEKTLPKRLDAPSNAAPGQVRLTKGALEQLTTENACGAANADPSRPAACSDWARRTLQHRRASSESCITLEEVAERPRASQRDQKQRQSSLASRDSYSSRFRLPLPPAALGDHDRPAHATTFPIRGGNDEVGTYRMGPGNDSDDSLPQLSLLSATQTAPVGWHRPSINLTENLEVSGLEPEQQRFWPLIDHQLDYTAARMLSAAMSAGIDKGSPSPAAAQGRGLRVSTFDDPPRPAGLQSPFRTVSASATAPSQATTRTTAYPSERAPYSNDAIHASSSPDDASLPSDELTNNSASGYSKLECGGPIYKPVSYAWARPSGSNAVADADAAAAAAASAKGGSQPIPMSPSSTLSHMIAYTRRQAGARLRQAECNDNGAERSSSSESEGDSTPRQWRFNAIVARGRRAPAHLVATPGSDIGERIGASSVVSASRAQSKGWTGPSDYFGNWDAPSQRRRVI